MQELDREENRNKKEEVISHWLEIINKRMESKNAERFLSGEDIDKIFA